MSGSEIPNDVMTFVAAPPVPKTVQKAAAGTETHSLKPTALRIHPSALVTTTPSFQGILAESNLLSNEEMNYYSTCSTLDGDVAVRDIRAYLAQLAEVFPSPRYSDSSLLDTPTPLS